MQKDNVQLEPVYMGIVVDNNDTDKSERLKIRLPIEDEIPEEHLTWIDRLYTSADFHQLPDIGEHVLVIELGRKKFWTEVVNLEALSIFTGDDYVKGFMKRHYDVYSKVYKESSGWDVLYVGDFHKKTDAYETMQTSDKIETTISSSNTKIKQNKVILETNGSNFKLTVNDVVIDTDGNKISVSNGSTDLLTVFEKLIAWAEAHTHPTPAGPSSPFVTEKPLFEDFKTNLKNLLK